MIIREGCHLNKTYMSDHFHNNPSEEAHETCGHNHDHTHDHNGHGHHHHAQITTDRNGNLNRAFKIGIWLNIVYVLIEGIFGLLSDSMGLLSDAGHNLSDVASLVIALIAFKASQRKPNERYTYGYRKATVEASVLNAIILYVAVALILIESVEKIFKPTHVDGGMVAWVAGVGVLVNGITTWLFMKDSKRDLNVKGAYLHMAADTLVSVGVVVSGIIISLTGWYLIDPIVGITIAALIAVSSFSMLKESMRLALDGVPSGINLSEVKEAILDADGVDSMHHLHVWAMSTTESAMTVHVVVDNPTDIDMVIDNVRKAVRPFGIVHSTVEAETRNASCACTDEICG